MSEQTDEEIVQEATLIPNEPLEVIVKNKPEKPEKTPYDESEDPQYENMYPTDEQIKEYEEEKE